MDLDTSVPRSRRALIGAGLGAVAATVASALGRPSPVAAAGALTIDVDNVATAQTTLHNYTTAATVFLADSVNGLALWGHSDNSVGVKAESSLGFGLQASSSTSRAVQAVSGSGEGVHGQSGTGIGVYGSTGGGIDVAGVWAVTSALAPAVYAESGAGTGVEAFATGDGYPGVRARHLGNSTGVHGHSGAAIPLVAPAKVGVFGSAAQDATSRGVLGQATTGTGVHGWVGAAASAPGPSAQTGVYGRCDIGTASRGVSGSSGKGYGLYGSTGSGTALYGTASASTGYALKTSGRLAFAKVSGVATLAANTTTITVTPGTDLTTASFVLVTPQGSPGGRQLWATVDAAANTISIKASAAAATSLKVAWLLVN